MATEQEIQEYLTKTNLTIKDMSCFWGDVSEVDGFYRKKSEGGMLWNGLNINNIKRVAYQGVFLKLDQYDYGTEKIDVLKSIYASAILAHLDSGQDLTESEISDLVWYYGARQRSINRDYTRIAKVIVNVGDRYFCIEQNPFKSFESQNFQPYEVQFDKVSGEWIEKA